MIFRGCCNKTIIPHGHVEYEIIIANYLQLVISSCNSNILLCIVTNKKGGIVVSYTSGSQSKKIWILSCHSKLSCLSESYTKCLRSRNHGMSHSQSDSQPPLGSFFFFEFLLWRYNIPPFVLHRVICFEQLRAKKNSRNRSRGQLHEQ